MVTDKDRGWNRLKRELLALADVGVVAVGIQGQEAAKEHPGGISNVRLGAVHEYGATIKHPGGTPFIRRPDGTIAFVSKRVADGLPRRLPVTKPHDIEIPERSFLRGALDENRAKYADLITKLADRVVTFKVGVKQALGLLGARVKADIQNRVKRGIAPPNTAETVRRKGSSKPLIDGGELVNAITWEIRDK